ncbi:ABC transporter substrate-binding protein [Alteribacter natronophilus]|uniref:ABC transporter substrate-binding protein n=1 Tax=Alteribacter natronophilus TaxID=2583810 RepID=UPI00110D89E0|nr:ABC transporter substrate-binding protein [Alteribacter natronophilus]TMW73644.1 ABC transporter substrate-binding protein [Alteribacter natronophilus]
MKRAFLTTVIGSTMVIAAACGGTDDAAVENDENGVNDTDQAGEEDSVDVTDEDTDDQEDDQAFPVTVEDARGEAVTLDEEPAEVISLVPSNTELIYGLDAWDQLTAVTANDDYPPEVSEMDTVGDMSIDVEQVIEMDPDLVMASIINQPDEINQIEDAGITVVVLNDANSFEELFDVIELAGSALGRTDEADDLISEMEQTVEEVRETGAEIPEDERATVWFEVSEDLYTTGSGTFADEMLTLIGADNVAGEEEMWVQFTEEDVVSRNPDVIVLTYGAYTEDARGQVLDRSAWQSVPAVENERIYELEDPNTVTRQGPRMIEGLQTLAEIIYPDRY